MESQEGSVTLRSGRQIGTAHSDTPPASNHLIAEQGASSSSADHTNNNMANPNPLKNKEGPMPDRSLPSTSSKKG